MTDTMTRIAPDDVLAASRRSGLAPVREWWIGDGADGLAGPCGCGLGIVLADRLGVEAARAVRRLGEDGAGSVRWGDEHAHVAGLLDLEPDYVWGYVAGFDGDAEFDGDAGPDGQDKPYRLGYEDGTAAARMVFKATEATS